MVNIRDVGEKEQTIQGTVITYPEGPSTVYFYMAAPPRTFSKYDFVRFDHGVGIIEEINYYGFVHPLDAFYEEALAFGEETTAMLCRVRILCDLKGEVVRQPPLPGSPVKPADETDLAVLSPKQGIQLGNIINTEVPFRMPPGPLVQRHFAILAMSGAGKSHLTKRIIEQFLNLPEESRFPVVVFDHHGEYKGFLEEYPDRMLGITGFKTDFRLLPSLLPLIVPELTPLQKQLIQQAVSESSTWDEAMKAIKKKAAEFGEKTSKSISIKLDEINAYGLVADRDEITPEWDFNTSAVVQLSNLDDRKKRLLTALFAHYLFERRKDGTAPPMLLIIEEAHNYVNAGRASDFPSRLVLERIAREGRKFAFGLGIISQRPRFLSKTILAQINTFFLLRMTNPSDIQVVRESCEQASDFLTSFLTNLKTGEAIAVSEILSFPVLFKTGEISPTIKKHFSKDLMEQFQEWKQKGNDYIDYLDN